MAEIAEEFNKYNNRTVPQRCFNVLDEARLAKEMFCGRFDVQINEILPLNTKVVQLSGDPLAFHMHKNRKFIDKLNERRKQNLSVKEVQS